MDLDGLTSGLIEEMAFDFTSFSNNLLNSEVQPFHKEWVEMFDSHKRSGFYAPRGFWKTSILGVSFPLWKIRFSQLTGGPYNFGVISSSLPQAGEVFRRMRRILEGNPFFKDLVPPPSSSYNYNSRVMELTDGSTIFIRPYSRTAVGIHVHYFLFDEATKVLDDTLFWNDLTAITNHYDGNICVTGTPDHPNDLVEQCIANEKYHTKVYVAEDEKGNLLWPQKYSKEKLEEIKASEGLASYAMNYLCRLIATGTQVFPPNDIAKQCYDTHSFSAIPDGVSMYFTGVDLAISEDGDYTVCTTVKLLPNGSIQIADIRKIRGTEYNMQLDMVEDVYNTYNPVKVLVDDSLFGIPFINDLIHRKYVPAEPFNFQGTHRNYLLNEFIRNFKRLIIPRSRRSNETRMMTDELIHELSGVCYGQTRTGMRTFETKTAHDDMLMSLAMAMLPASGYDATPQPEATSVLSFRNNTTSVGEGFLEDDVGLAVSDIDFDLGSGSGLEELL